jgi:hypothetical protein
MNCVKCANGLDHCHDTLVIHLDGRVECTDGDCTDLDEVRHLLVVDCSSVLGGCECVQEILIEDIRQAS